MNPSQADSAKKPRFTQHHYACPNLGSICQIVLAWEKLVWGKTPNPAMGGEPPCVGPIIQMRGCPPLPPACCILHLCCFEPTSRITPQPPEGRPQWVHPSPLHRLASHAPGHPCPRPPPTSRSPSGHSDLSPFRAVTVAQSHAAHT